MSSDKYNDERIYKDGWTAGNSKNPKSTNPHTGDDAKRWDLGWERGNQGKEYDGYE